MSDLIKMVFTVEPEQTARVEAFLFTEVQHGWEEEDAETGTRYIVHVEDNDPARELAARIREMWPDSGLETSGEMREPWAEQWKDFFTPISCGERFEILPPWHKPEHEGMTPIIIEPKMAFGTGHHPTTALCMQTEAELMEKGLISEGMEFLDLGCGSGILGIGLCKLGLTGRGLDIDPQAIECSLENVRINDVADKVELAVGSIDSVPAGKTYDIIVANILSEPLIDMAPLIRAKVTPGGCLVLSGILGTQAQDVAKAYMEQGLGEPEIKHEGEWSVLIWEKAD